MHILSHKLKIYFLQRAMVLQRFQMLWHHMHLWMYLFICNAVLGVRIKKSYGVMHHPGLWGALPISVSSLGTTWGGRSVQRGLGRATGRLANLHLLPFMSLKSKWRRLKEKRRQEQPKSCWPSTPHKSQSSGKRSRKRRRTNPKRWVKYGPAHEESSFDVSLKRHYLHDVVVLLTLFS